jgi:hypothetical protein
MQINIEDKCAPDVGAATESWAFEEGQIVTQWTSRPCSWTCCINGV